LDASLKEAIQEDLRPTLFVVRDVFLTPRDKFSKFYPIRHGETLAPRRHCRQAGKFGGVNAALRRRLKAEG